MIQKNNELQKPRTNEEWEVLLHKYYEGETSRIEEIWLDEWLLSSSVNSNAAHNPDRAVKSWIALRRREKKNDSIRKKTLTTIKYAAAIIVLFTISSITAYNARESVADDYYVAYVHNQKITNQKQVYEQMLKALDDVSDKGLSVEAQLSDIFEGIQSDSFTH